jgi:hypothetical protein
MITVDLSLRTLLADLTTWRRLGEQFSGSGAELSQGEMLSLSAMGLAAVIAIWFLQRLAYRQEHPQSYYRPRRLFRQLCRTHRLKRADCQRLRRLAQRFHLRQPALLFVEPDYFVLENLPSEFSHERQEIDALRRRLFAIDR